MADFDPYIQIQPKQGVTSTYSPYGAGAQPGFVQPSEDWGKILGDFSKSLSSFFASQETEKRKEQDLEAAALVAEQDSEELSGQLHKAAQDGQIPPGFSPYLLKQTRVQLARKAGREMADWAKLNGQMWEDPDFVERDEEGNELGSTPTEVLARERERLLAKYPGLLGTAEGRGVFEAMYSDIESEYVVTAGKTQSKARVGQAVTGYSDDVQALIQTWEETLDPAADEETQGVYRKQLQEGVDKLQVELREAIKGLPGISLPQETLNKTTWAVFEKALAGDITALSNVEDAAFLQEKIDMLKEVNPRGKNEKDAWGHAFAAEIDVLENKLSARIRVLSDADARFGTTDTKAARALEAHGWGLEGYEQLDVWTSAEVPPSNQEVFEFLVGHLEGVAGDKGYTDIQIRMAATALVPRMTRELDAAISRQERADDAPTPEELAQTTFDKDADKLFMAGDYEGLVAAIDDGNNQIDIDTGRAGTLLVRLEQKRSRDRGLQDEINAKVMTIQRITLGAFNQVIEGEMQLRLSGLDPTLELDVREALAEGKLPGYEELQAVELTQLYAELGTFARDQFNTLILDDPSNNPQKQVDDMFVSDEFLNGVKDLTDAYKDRVRDRIRSYQLPTKGDAPRLPVTRMEPMTEETFEDIDPDWWWGGLLNDERLGEIFAKGMEHIAGNGPGFVDYIRTLPTKEGADWPTLKAARNAILKPLTVGGGYATLGTANEDFWDATLDENRKPVARDEVGVSISQSALDAKWKFVAMVDAIEHWDNPRTFERLNSSSPVVLDKRGIQIPNTYLDWERFGMLGRNAFVETDLGAVNEEAIANNEFMKVYEEVFLDKDGDQIPQADLSKEAIDRWIDAQKAWLESPSGKVYRVLPDTLHRGEYRFLLAQKELWEAHQQ